MNEARGDIQVRVVTEGRKLKIVECVSSRLCTKLEELGKLSPDGYLDVYEAGYLAYKGMLELNGKVGDTAFEKILPLIDDFLMFQVYLDLRKRGKRVIRGPAKRSLLIIEPNRIIEVHVLGEGEHITPGALADLADYSTANSRIPIVAIVDSTGIITYYNMRRSDNIL